MWANRRWHQNIFLCVYQPLCLFFVCICACHIHVWHSVLVCTWVHECVRVRVSEWVSKWVSGWVSVVCVCVCVCVCVSVCDIKSKHQHDPCHLCENLIKINTLLHKLPRKALLALRYWGSKKLVPRLPRKYY